MDYYILINVFLTFLVFSSNHAQSPNRTVPCSFNNLCQCVVYGNNEQLPPDWKGWFNDAYNEVYCNEVPFTKLPVFPSFNTTSKITIVGSGIEILEDYSFSNLKLKSLNLANNKIIIASPKVLSSSNATLEALDMSYNLLYNVPDEMVNKLVNLKILSLESNSITSLKSDWGNLKNTLRSLYLAKNDISYLHLSFNFSLSNFQQLLSLNLKDNYIKIIEKNALPFTLKSLNLEHNHLDTFPSDTIEVLRNLQMLNLADNYIKKLPEYGINTKSSLNTLDLSSNLLTSVSDINIGKSLKIDNIDLSYNDIGQISSKSFNGLSCSKLDLSHNRISLMSEKAFYGLTNSLETLNLAHNELYKFPKALNRLKKLKTLTLNRNDLHSMSESPLSNTSSTLTYLSMSRNSFSSLPRYSLRGLKKLKTLLFSYNKIYSISTSDFSVWGDQLQVLALASNKLTQLEVNVFKSLTRLRSLTLAYNKLNDIHEKAFSNLNMLMTLDLGYSLNSTFPEKHIKGCTNLRDLYLDNNKLVTIPEKGIRNFRLLTNLNLEFNDIIKIPSYFFKANYHVNLMDVRFSFNKISYIYTHTFEDLKSLQYITLSHNEITSIGTEAFKNLPSKLVIVLSNNRLSNIANRTFLNLPNLTELDLHNNNLRDLNWHMFDNVTNNMHPLTLNLSRNRIENILSEMTNTVHLPKLIATKLYIEKIDLSHNLFKVVPYESLRAINSSLKIIDLGYNYIKTLHNNPFSYTSNLEILNLQHNQIEDIRGSQFYLYKLQILDLSHNRISSLLLDQFSNLKELRVLDISHNLLSAIPSEVFKNTKLERLILKNNLLVTVPSQALVPIGHSLGYLDLSYNRIQDMDMDQFTNAPLLTYLNLCHNSLTQIRLPVFRNLNFLLTLEICSNRLPSLEYFHHEINLRHLNLAESRLNKIPFLEQVNLISLNLSNNEITQIRDNFLFGIPNLRILDLSRNNITMINNPRWNEAENLVELDFSSNPIEVITSESFSGLNNLKVLKVQNLHKLKRFDADALSSCKLLSTLYIQSWPNIEKYRYRLPNVLSTVQQLNRLYVNILEEKLTDQLIGELPPKLKYIEITGEKLTEVNPDALGRLRLVKDMVIKFTGTNITTFPPKFFHRFMNIRATIDLRGNNLRLLGPEPFYKTPAGVQLFGTTAFSGGIHVKDNYLECGCEASWMGLWLKRYMRETLNIHSNNVKYGRDIYESMLDLTCYNNNTGTNVKLITYEHKDCYVGGSPALLLNVLLAALVAVNIFKNFI